MTQRLSGHFSIFGLIVFAQVSSGNCETTGWQSGGGNLSRITPIFLSYLASRKNKILTTLSSTLLSLNLTKSEVEEREKRARRWRRNYLFVMSLLLVSNDINHHENFKRLTRCENSHESRCYAQSRLTRLIWARSRIALIILVPSRVTENPFATLRQWSREKFTFFSSDYLNASRSPSPLFVFPRFTVPVNNLTRSPLTAALYYPNAWNRLQLFKTEPLDNAILEH